MVGAVIDVIIPCRNEEKTIADIVLAFREHPAIGQVIVVDNASQDQTIYQATISHADRVLQNPVVGKGQSVEHGLEYVSTDQVFLCDGDLHNFTPNHITRVLENPDSRDRMVIGVTDWVPNVPWKVNKRIWSWVSGIRRVPTFVLNETQLYGYTVEVMLNRTCHLLGVPVLMTRLEGVVGTPRWGPERQWAMDDGRKWLVENGYA